MLKKVLSKIFFFRHWPKKYLIIIVIAILSVGWFIYSRNTVKTPIEYVKVERKDIKSTVSASGLLTGKETANLKFKLSGKLATLNVKENDLVTKGNVIASLDTQDLSIALQQAQNNWLSKDATAKRVEDDVKDHDNSETFTQREERIAAQTARDSAFDGIKAAQRNFQDATLVAPISGTVVSVGPVVGQNVTAADNIATIVDESELYFDSEIDESDINKVSLGQKAEVSLNSYPNKMFKATVAEILPQTKTTSSGATVIVVRLKLDDQAIRFIANINGQSDIITEQKFSVLAVPQDALIEDDKVYIQEGKSFKKVTIKKGLQSNTEAEVLGGLTENQMIVKNPSAVKVK